MIFAVVPAAGHSTRMGRPKLSLPLGDRTVLERVVSALQAGSVDHIVVVVGPQVPELATLAESAGAIVCRLSEPTTDMRSTVEHGLRMLETSFAPSAGDAFLLAPGDHPSFGPGVVRDLCDAFRGDPIHSIIVPAFAGRRGHPVLIGWKHVASIRAMPSELGINAYLRDHGAETGELAVDDSGILFNLDTREDYEAMRRQIRNW